MVAYAFRHHEIVFLAWPIDTRGAKHYVIEIVAYRVEKPLCHELALSVSRVWPRRVVLVYLLGRLLLLYGAENAQAAHVDKALYGHVELQDGVDKVLGALIVHLHEIVPVQTLGDTRRVHHIVEVVTAERVGERAL